VIYGAIAPTPPILSTAAWASTPSPTQRQAGLGSLRPGIGGSHRHQATLTLEQLALPRPTTICWPASRSPTRPPTFTPSKPGAKSATTSSCPARRSSSTRSTPPAPTKLTSSTSTATATPATPRHVDPRRVVRRRRRRHHRQCPVGRAHRWVIGVENRVISLAGLTLDGPAGCTVSAGCPLLASVTPATATLPVTYTWQATGQPPGHPPQRPDRLDYLHLGRHRCPDDHRHRRQRPSLPRRHPQPNH